MTVTELYANLASALLAGNVVPEDQAIQVENGTGARFPSPTGGDYCRLCIEDTSGNVEIVYLTARSVDSLTVTRAQEGTTARGFTAGISRIEHRPTAGMFAKLLDTDGDTVNGPIDFDGNELQNALLKTSTFDGGVIQGATIRAADGSTANQIFVPPSGADPTIGGQTIYHSGNLSSDTLGPLAFPAGMVVMWYGLSTDIPTGWALCNGASGTPDLRDKFVIGAGGSYAATAGLSGGATSFSGTSAISGQHYHTVGGTALSESQIPPHRHSIWAANGTYDSNADGWDVSGVRGIPGENVGTFNWRELNNNSEPIISETGDGLEHTHSLTEDVTGHQHSVSIPNTLPPYVGLFFIIKL